MIEGGQVSFDKLVDEVRAQQHVWVRLGAVLKDDIWTALAVDAVAPEEPPDWEERTWHYPEARFHAFVEEGQRFAHWLEAGKVTFDNDEVVLPRLPLDDPNAWTQVHGIASRQDYDLYEPLTWPTAFYELPRPSGIYSGPQRMLIADGAPSFDRFLDAAIAFFGLRSRMTASVSQLPTPAIRIQDPTGRIARVVIRPMTVEVHLEGAALVGLTVELAGLVPGPQVRLEDRRKLQKIEFSIPDGLPEQAWIVLKTGTTCVDRKFVNWRYSLSHDPDVEIVQEPASIVEALVAAGEGPEIEFKKQVPTDPNGRKKVCRTLAAFANGHGGHMLFGVDDDGQIAGVGADRPGQSYKDTVTRWITGLVVPHLDFVLDIVETEDGGWLLHVEVQEGASPPYGVEPANPSYYIRRGATTFPASAEDVRTIARARPPVPWSRLGLAGIL